VVVRSTEDRRRILFWRPDTSSVRAMLRVEHEDRLRTTYSEHFLVVVVYQGAFDGWYRGAVRTHVAGSIKLKEPGEVHRDVRVHAPFTLQGAGFSPQTVAAAAAALGLRGTVHFKAAGFGARERATRLAFAMHAALVRRDVPEIERATRVAETLGELLGDDSRSGAPRAGDRAPRAVRLARAFLHDAPADKITLDDLAACAGLDKFHLVRAFRAEVGLPPYEYLTHLRVWKARELLQRGSLVAEAAQAVGFYDESQLHRHFRRIVGVTPGSFSRSFPGRARQSQHRPSGARPGEAHWPHERTHPR
jgi:AraC-like DNA-binding protein